MWDADYSAVQGGGGFFDHPNQDSPSGTGKKKNEPKRAQNLFPVVIGMIKECDADEFTMWGEQASIVKIVGIVRKFDVSSTKITYIIEDHTGEIQVVLWLDQDSSSNPNIPVDKEGVYVRVFGTLRNQDNEKVIMVLNIAPIKSMNEPTTHLLEVMHVRFQMEKGNRNEDVIIRNNNPGASLSNSMSFQSNTRTDDDSYGMTATQQKVYKLIQSCTVRVGIHRNNILEQFQKNQYKEVEDAIEFLVSEGHVFSTINHDHFKLTDSS